MNQPGGNQQSNGSANSTTAIVKNNLRTTQEFKLTIVTDATGVGTNLNLLVIPGPVPTLLASKFATTLPDQQHTTISSSVSAGTAGGYTELKQYLAQVGMHISYVRIQTTDTSLYNGSLFIGEMPVNGIAAPEEIVLSDYATTIGGGGTYDKTLKITDRAFANTKNFFMYFSQMPLSATVSIALGIDGIGNTVTVSGN